MRIIKILLGLTILGGFIGCDRSNAQLPNPDVPKPSDTTTPIASEFFYPLGKTGDRLTEPKDRTDEWYNARNFGEADHLGEDWNKNSGGNTDCGETVFAIAAGRIVYAENGGPGWGNVVIIEHRMSDGTKVQSLYGHLLKIEKTNGDVAAREKIGEVGNADGRYLCHLHLEIREASCPMWGQPGPGYATDRAGWIDPSDFIDRRQSEAILSFYDPMITLADLEPGNNFGDFARYDFSPVWSGESELLGFIGEDYQRIGITLLSVKKSPAGQTYVVRARTATKDVIRPLQGRFSITQIRRLKTLHWGLDDEFRDRGIKVEGVLTGEYELSGGTSGSYKGRLSALWYLDKYGRIMFDAIESQTSDAYRNNQFIGFWTSSSGLERVRSNWGDYRIPDSGDLDIGAGEFSPNEKYLKNGWQSYRDKFGRRDN